MNLSAFLPHVAEVLAKGASEQGMSVGQIKGHLRNWQSGRQFLSLVNEHITDGKPATREALQNLAEMAQLHRYRVG